MGKTPKQDLRLVARKLETSGQFREAQAAWIAAVKANPKDAATRLGIARFANRRASDAAAALPHVLALLKLAPRDAVSHQEAAETYARLERFAEARKHAAKAMKLDPKSADIAYVAATIENRAGRYIDAEAMIDRALTLRPGHLPSELLRATILNSKGEMDAAQELCRTLFDRAPQNLDVARIYHRTGRMTSDDPIIANLRDSLGPSLPEGARALRAQVETILGKVASDESRHDDAFAHYARAKDIDPAPYDITAYRRHVTELVKGIKRPAFLGRKGHDSDAPVLIVGMPRSGSSLLEQILSGHPGVASAGESPALRNVAIDLRMPQHHGRAMVTAVTGVSDKEAAKLGEAYLAGLDIGGSPRRIIDKRLHNFELLGLFARMFPRGRVLHTLRDPMDNCVSVYMQPFRKTHAYAWKLADLGQYYVEYRRLMDHWHNELPLPIMDVAYEDTVADIEAQARRIVEFVGLGWDDRCLAFQETENPSRTLSQWQVRQPIYTTSVEKWRRYDDRLEPLKSELSALYETGLD